jgi:hypothetical protein
VQEGHGHAVGGSSSSAEGHERSPEELHPAPGQGRTRASRGAPPWPSLGSVE